jgi:hypothetical protein
MHHWVNLLFTVINMRWKSLESESVDLVSQGSSERFLIPAALIPASTTRLCFHLAVILQVQIMTPSLGQLMRSL